MDLAYNGNAIVINPLGLDDIRAKLDTVDDTDIVVLCFGCTDRSIGDNLLHMAYNVILSNKEIEVLVNISPIELNAFNYRTFDISRYAVVIIGRLLKWFMEVKWDDMNQLLLTFGFYEHRCNIKIDGTFKKTKMLADVMTPTETGNFNKMLESVCILIPTKDMKKAVADINIPDFVPVCFMMHKDDIDLEYKKKCPKHYMIKGYDYRFNYSKIHNETITQELKGMYKYYILCNDDIELDVSTMDKLLEPLACDDEIGVVGAKLMYPNGTVQHEGVKLDRLRGAKHINHGGKDRELSINTFDSIHETTFALVAIRAKCFYDIKGFDNKFVYDFNDIDFCIRAKNRGWQVVCNNEAVAIHHESRTRKADNKTSNKNELKIFKEKHGRLLRCK